MKILLVPEECNRVTGKPPHDLLAVRKRGLNALTQMIPNNGRVLFRMQKHNDVSRSI
jgi:hypothetical protein